MYRATVGAGGLEDGQRLLDEGTQLRRLALRLEVRAYDGSPGSSRRAPQTLSPAFVARCARESARRSASSTLPAQNRASHELGFEGEVELGRRHERGCALQEARRRPVVLAERRSLAAGGQAAPRRRGQRVVSGQAELGTVARPLLEVVAEDLVELDEITAVLLEPGREARVQLGADRLRECVVGGVADQDVAEAEAVLACELGPVGPDQLLADECRQTWSDLGLIRRERLDGAAVEDLALDRASLEHAPLRRLELVEARGEQRLQGGRYGDVAVGLAAHRQHLADEERVAARRAGDPRAQRPGERLRDQSLDVVVAQRLEP